MNIYTVHFDGSCGPNNPGGTAAYGFTLRRNGEKLAEGRNVVGTGPAMSNNLAEFAGLASALTCASLPAAKGDIINVRGDSLLVINIMSRRWKPKPDKLYYPAYLAADQVLRDLRKSGVLVNFDWIQREQNQECDTLSKYDNLSLNSIVFPAAIS